MGVGFAETYLHALYGTNKCCCCAKLIASKPSVIHKIQRVTLNSSSQPIKDVAKGAKTIVGPK